ncbi:hypothetical protein EPIB1_1171 [Tritonibacter mobilis]|uniref:hypothetical protein n=1 Tax=Tritonibacter mobilis TaxID=379347 RepID=UPI000F6CA7B1|nr:hypothetical protein [Tritonibacter mobilis]VCU58273.1 hypothetical protein EPIB1_1171 [Tritonibacter mobilis]
MKIKILTDADHRISSARSQRFRAGSEINLPKDTAMKLIEEGKAVEVKRDTKGD